MLFSIPVCALQLCLEHGQAEARTTELIAVVKHEGVAVQQEDMGIALHLRIPTLLGNIDAGQAVVTHPFDQVGRTSVAEAVGIIALSSETVRLTIAEIHVIHTAQLHDRRQRLALIGIEAIADGLAAVPPPVNAVRRGGMSDLVDPIRRLLIGEALPLGAVDVPHVIGAVVALDEGVGYQKRLMQRRGQQRTRAMSLEAQPAIAADRESYRRIRRYRNSSVYAGGIGQHPIAVRQDVHRKNPVLIETTQRALLDDRSRRNADDTAQIVREID